MRTASSPTPTTTDGYGSQPFLVVPNSLTIVVYLLAMAAGVRLLQGRQRALAALSVAEQAPPTLTASA